MQACRHWWCNAMAVDVLNDIWDFSNSVSSIYMFEFYITVTSEWARWCLKSPAARLFTQSFIQTPRKISKLRMTGLCAGKSTVTGEFPAQMASIAENVSIWWRHNESIKHLVFEATCISVACMQSYCECSHRHGNTYLVTTRMSRQGRGLEIWNFDISLNKLFSICPSCRYL